MVVVHKVACRALLHLPRHKLHLAPNAQTATHAATVQAYLPQHKLLGAVSGVIIVLRYFLYDLIGLSVNF